ncbi:MAG: hypothetical protein JWO70_4728 [Betaproteobacteria bacterium]|jgi:hypothetical protein|nr:hypothetical protein [Betaproteobacteria bacterium]
MQTRKDHSPSTGHGEHDADTSSYAQDHGTQGGKAAANRRNDKMPHERDESARSTGNRMDEQVPPSKRQISDAEKDVEAGRVDTDRRGVPSDVPSDDVSPDRR